MAVEDDRRRVVEALWANIRGFNRATVRQYPAAARAIAAGANPDDVVAAMMAAAYEATFGALFQLTADQDIRALAESGVAVSLHEDLLTADPTGRGGADLFS